MGVSSIKIILLLYFNLYLLRTVVLRKLFDRDSQYKHYSKSFEYIQNLEKVYFGQPSSSTSLEGLNLDLSADKLSFQQTERIILEQESPTKHRLHLGLHNAEFDFSHFIYMSSDEHYFPARLQFILGKEHQFSTYLSQEW